MRFSKPGIPDFAKISEGTSGESHYGFRTFGRFLIARTRPLLRFQAVEMNDSRIRIVSPIRLPVELGRESIPFGTDSSRDDAHSPKVTPVRTLIPGLVDKFVQVSLDEPSEIGIRFT